MPPDERLPKSSFMISKRGLSEALRSPHHRRDPSVSRRDANKMTFGHFNAPQIRLFLMSPILSGRAMHSTISFWRESKRPAFSRHMMLPLVS